MYGHQMTRLNSERKHLDWGQALLEKNCAKSPNSNFSTINQMSHIQLFFTQSFPTFYLSLVKEKAHDSSFLQQTNRTNLFQLTTQLILSAQKCIKLSSQFKFGESIASHWLISYESLRNTTLPVEELDNQIVRWFKTSLNYVHVQMIQILVRLLLIHFEASFSKEITSKIKKHIQEISYIYPALKIEISFMPQQIDLTYFFDHLLHQIQQHQAFTSTFKKALEELVDRCGFMGSLAKIFQKYYEKKLSTTQEESQLEARSQQRQPKILKNDVLPQRKVSNVMKDQNSVRHSSVSCDKKSNIDQLQHFRKKKRIIKERLKNHNESCKTPYRDRSHPLSPTTQKTGVFTFSTCSDTTENNASSLLYRKLLCNMKPRERTLYHGEKKFFVPKKTSIMDPEHFIQQIMVPSLEERPSTFDLIKMTEKKSIKTIMESTQDESHDFFYVPETPKPNHLKKGMISSLGEGGEGVSTFKL